MANFLFPFAYVPDPDKGKPVALGEMYFGEADKDPESFPTQVLARQEDGTEVPISLGGAIQLSAGGVPTYNGSAVQIVVLESPFSLRVRNSQGSQVYYAAIVDGIIDPSSIVTNIYSSLDDALSADGDLGDIAITGEYFSGTGIGGAKYKIVAAGTGVPDGGSYINKTDGSGYQLQLIPDQGKVHMDVFGAVVNDYSFDNSAVYLAAANYGVVLSQQDGGSSIDTTGRVDVIFSPGNIYAFKDSTSALDTQAVRVNFVCEGGNAIISGYDPSVPSIKNPLGFTFGRVYKTTFKNLSFVGFNTLHQWDTNNVDSALVEYIGCEFIDINLGVDTVSYPLSRSTRLVFNECRSSGTLMLTDCYCDQLEFRGGSWRNGDDSGAFVKADSQVVVNGGIWTPYEVGDDARWFDLYDNAVSGSRGIVVEGGARFGPEDGGIPVVRNFMEGTTAVTNHVTNYIVFYGAYAPASPGSPQPQASVVMLADDGVNSYAPSIIGFYGTSVRSRLGLVSTLNAFPINKDRGNFVIDISYASQSFQGNFDTSPGVPLVEDILEGFLVNKRLYNEPVILTAANPMAIDVTGYPIEAPLQINGTGCVIDSMSGAFDGQVVTIRFQDDTSTVNDHSTGGGRIFLAGGVDFTTDEFGTITLQYHRSGTKWFELGRCSR